MTAVKGYILIPCQEKKLLEERECCVEDEETTVEHFFGVGRNVKLTVLLRPQPKGLYVYSSSSSALNLPNIRATRLAFACGLLSLRFRGDVLVFSHWKESLKLSDIDNGAVNASPDLRRTIQSELCDNTRSNDFPVWLRQACQQNYHDEAALEQFQNVMKKDKSDDESVDIPDSAHVIDGMNNELNDKKDAIFHSDKSTVDSANDASDNEFSEESHHFIAKTPLCFHCRGPSRNLELCPTCKGVYFCPPPRTCRTECWSHSCLCRTWKLYTDRRASLKEFPYFEGGWHLKLTSRENEMSEEPCRLFLRELVGLDIEDECEDSRNKTSWWRTEISGWEGGKSTSAKWIDPSIRKLYCEGFFPVEVIPPQRRPTQEEVAPFEVNEHGLLQLKSWKDYYRLRNISLSSPVAILLSFPLTIYYALERFGSVPVAVARILKRPIRIHLVGTEKELNFLDLFQEVGYLLPSDVMVSLDNAVRLLLLPIYILVQVP